MALQENQLAPINIQIQDDTGKLVTLKDFLGRYLVMYFYPRDDTPGCTKEACDFRDYNVEIEKLGVKVIGISDDDIRSHEKFKEKYGLNFTLLSDPEHKFLEAFGVWGEKNMYGKKYMGTLRTTFILDKEGKIVKVWEKVNPEGHAREVYEVLKEMV